MRSRVSGIVARLFDEAVVDVAAGLLPTLLDWRRILRNVELECNRMRPYSP
jgi:hypothetical protein